MSRGQNPHKEEYIPEFQSHWQNVSGIGDIENNATRHGEPEHTDKVHSILRTQNNTEYLSIFIQM